MPYRNQYNEPLISYGQMNLLIHIRNLWREIATWTRTYLISKSVGPEIAEEAFARLYKIPEEFGTLFRLIFGDQIAEQYVTFLSVQLVLIKEIIDAQIAGNSTLAGEKIMQLYQNADERARHIALINPYWDETAVRNNIYLFHQYTLEEILAFLTEDYRRDIDIYDRLLHHADSMGDYFTQGLFNYITSNSLGR